MIAMKFWNYVFWDKKPTFFRSFFKLKWPVTFQMPLPPMRLETMKMRAILFANFTSNFLAFVTRLVEIQIRHRLVNWSAMAFVKFSFVMMLQLMTANQNVFSLMSFLKIFSNLPSQCFFAWKSAVTFCALTPAVIMRFLHMPHHTSLWKNFTADWTSFFLVDINVLFKRRYLLVTNLASFL